MPGKQGGGGTRRQTPARQELRARSARRREARAKQRTAAQDARHAASLYALKLPPKLATEIQARREAGETFAALARDYGCTEFEIARIVRYGKLTPWQHARARRNAARLPVQEAYAKRNKG